MPTATIIPQYVNPPKPGARSGSVKDGDGNYWGVDPRDLSMFTVGQPTTVEYLEQTGKDGRVWKNIKRVQNPHSQGAHPGPAPGPKPQQNGVGFRPSMAPKDAQEARISLLCQAYAQAGIVPSAVDVETLVMNVTKGVQNFATKTTSPQRADDMADEIPY